jgi:hypothetical protein
LNTVHNNLSSYGDSSALETIARDLYSSDELAKQRQEEKEWKEELDLPRYDLVS